MQINESILRVFNVRAKPGEAVTLRQKLSDTSIDVVRGEPGNLGYFFGESLSTDEHDLVFISVWQDLEAIKQRFGDSWQESFLPPGYEALIESCSITHLKVSGELGS